MRPEVFTILKRHGLNNSDIARAFGVDRNTVSRWSRGLRTMSQAVQRDLEELAALVSTAAAQGREAHEVLAHWRPSVVVTRWQRDQVVETHGGGPFDLPEDLLKALATARTAEERDNVLLHAVGRTIARLEAEAGTFTVAERMQLRRLFQTGESILRVMYQRDATRKEG
jgi:transcriptional regulator with XRE-family HTH domain